VTKAKQRTHQEIPECSKTFVFGKPEICKSNFPVHAQEPPGITKTFNVIPPVSGWWFLTHLINK